MVISDAAIVSRIREGEFDAFSVLFDRYHARCVRLASRLLQDPDDAADAVQDAFIRAYLSLDRYQERERFGSWLLCIVANRCRSATAGARRRAHLASEWVRAFDDPADDERLGTRDHALAERLEKALGDLPPSTRAAVVRKYGDGLTYEEISADTGVAVSALKMRVARGSAQLRRTLLGAGISVAAIAMILAGHTRESHRHRAVTAIACDTLRAIMRDTLSPAARDSILPANRCNEPLRDAARDADRVRRSRDLAPPTPAPEF